jgi:hypothetical protein
MRHHVRDMIRLWIFCPGLFLRGLIITVMFCPTPAILFVKIRPAWWWDTTDARKVVRMRYPYLTRVKVNPTQQNHQEFCRECLTISWIKLGLGTCTDLNSLKAQLHFAYCALSLQIACYFCGATFLKLRAHPCFQRYMWPWHVQNSNDIVPLTDDTRELVILTIANLLDSAQPYSK